MYLARMAEHHRRGRGRTKKAVWETAFHEAGHAVVSLRLGRGSEALSIVSEGERLGSHHSGELPPGIARRLSEGSSSLRDRQTIESMVMVFFAGTIAESICRGHEPRRLGGARSDFAKAIDVASHLIFEPKELGTYLDWLFVRTVNSVRHSWRKVEELAGVLLIRQTLGGREVRAVVQRAMLGPAARDLTAVLTAASRGRKQ